ncbi:MAG: hypothetical protein H6672_12660 [Anaerolineaceae bacterium]|nr:hypothetical protein [Anaerolineaceae bacterium]
MVEIDIQYEIDDQPVNVDELEEDYELTETLLHTGEQIRQQVTHKLVDVHCDEHDRDPRVVVTATYSRETGQMELSYHLDTCCQMLLLRAVQALNH